MCKVRGTMRPDFFVGILLLGCSASAGETIRCGSDAWQEAPYSPVSMEKYANSKGCWMVTASSSGGIADRAIDACNEASRCLVVGAEALVFAYGRPGGVSEFSTVDVACDAVCP